MLMELTLLIKLVGGVSFCGVTDGAIGFVLEGGTAGIVSDGGTNIVLEEAL